MKWQLSVQKKQDEYSRLTEDATNNASQLIATKEKEAKESYEMMQEQLTIH